MAGRSSVGLVFFGLFASLLVSWFRGAFISLPDTPTGACVNTTNTERKRQPWIHAAVIHHLGQLALSQLAAAFMKPDRPTTLVDPPAVKYF